MDAGLDKLALKKCKLKLNTNLEKQVNFNVSIVQWFRLLASQGVLRSTP
jgi:hypothetical protein